MSKETYIRGMSRSISQGEFDILAKYNISTDDMLMINDIFLTKKLMEKIEEFLGEIDAELYSFDEYVNQDAMRKVLNSGFSHLDGREPLGEERAIYLCCFDVFYWIADRYENKELALANLIKGATYAYFSRKAKSWGFSRVEEYKIGLKDIDSYK